MNNKELNLSYTDSFSLYIASLFLLIVVFAILHTKWFRNSLQPCMGYAIYSEKNSSAWSFSIKFIVSFNEFFFEEWSHTR